MNPPDFCTAALRGSAVLILYQQEIPPTAIDRYQISHELPCHSQCGSIRIPFLPLLVIDHGQARAVSRCQLCRLDQHALQMLIALLGKRTALDHLRRTLLGADLSPISPSPQGMAYRTSGSFNRGTRIGTARRSFRWPKSHAA